MYFVHVTIQEILFIIQRRYRLLIMPAVLVMVMCTIAAFVMPRKYVSSTTILIQRDEVLNPLIRYDMAIALASEDRMQAFEEIVYSRGTIEALIDSLHLEAGVDTEAERQSQIRLLMGNIQLDRPGEATVRVSFAGNDPVLVQRATAFLARHSINTMIEVENQKNDLTVKFFEDKMREYQQKFEESRESLVPVLQQRIADAPIEVNTISRQIEDIDRQLREIDLRIQEYEKGLKILETFPGAFRGERGQEALLNLLRMDLPFIADLRPLSARYGDYMLRYTENYPGVIEIKSQILDLLERMRTAIVYEIPEEHGRRQRLQNQQNRLVAAIQQSSVQRMDQEKETNFNMYKQLYNDMKVKLEQARTNRELRNMGSEQFVIIDPPIVPSYPTKPNRKRVILGGMMMGVLLGIVVTALAELFDTTVRSARDLAVYNLPVITLIPERSMEHGQAQPKASV